VYSLVFALMKFLIKGRVSSFSKFIWDALCSTILLVKIPLFILMIKQCKNVLFSNEQLNIIQHKKVGNFF
jgi:hypothetical protein